MQSSIRTLIFIAIYILSLTTDAQVVIQLFSSFSKPAQAKPADCHEAANIVLSLLDKYPHPDSWTFVIACDDPSWQRVLTHIGIVESDGRHYGETFEDTHVTYLRGSTLLEPDSPRATAEHLVAHELAHIYLHAHEENKVEALAESWIKKTPGSTKVQLQPQTSPLINPTLGVLGNKQ